MNVVHALGDLSRWRIGWQHLANPSDFGDASDEILAAAPAMISSDSAAKPRPAAVAAAVTPAPVKAPLAGLTISPDLLPVSHLVAPHFGSATLTKETDR